MALVCERCGKGIMRGHAVSHAKNRSKRVFRPNLQTLRVKTDGQRRKMTLCTKCVRIVRREMKEKESGSKEKASEKQSLV